MHHTLPAPVLLGLQKQLDRLFDEAFPGVTGRLCVPQVEILTEPKDPSVVPVEAGEHKEEKLVGLHVFLDESWGPRLSRRMARRACVAFARTGGMRLSRGCCIISEDDLAYY
jgi:hypothetical protein